jgi:hypothetical protein
MPPLQSSVAGYVSGDTLNVTRTINGIPSGRMLVKAWLTLKVGAADADPGVLQKVITTVNVAGTGQITDDGTGDGIGALLFQLTATDTAALGTTTRVYDVQIKLDDGSIATVEMGTITFVQGVTAATS